MTPERYYEPVPRGLEIRIAEALERRRRSGDRAMTRVRLAAARGRELASLQCATECP